MLTEALKSAVELQSVPAGQTDNRLNGVPRVLPGSSPPVTSGEGPTMKNHDATMTSMTSKGGRRTLTLGIAASAAIAMFVGGMGATASAA